MGISKRTRIEVFKRDDFTCQYCGALGPDVPLHVDHILPRSLGGSDEMRNLTTACQHCNLGKSARRIVPAEKHRLARDVADEAGAILDLVWAVPETFAIPPVDEPRADPADVAWLTKHCGGTPC